VQPDARNLADGVPKWACAGSMRAVGAWLRAGREHKRNLIDHVIDINETAAVYIRIFVWLRRYARSENIIDQEYDIIDVDTE
jgi:hypothetical protein